MILKTTLIVGLILIIAFLLHLMYLGKASRNGNAPGLVNGSLVACPDKPNCVCSEHPEDSDHFIEAIPFTGSGEESMARLSATILSMQGLLVSQSDNYLSATFTSKLFGFVDDVEFRIDTEQGVIHVRSASRVGHSDLDANRKRVENIKAEFSQDQ